MITVEKNQRGGRREEGGRQKREERDRSLRRKEKSLIGSKGYSRKGKKNCSLREIDIKGY